MRAWGKNDVPHWNALFGVSFMMSLNLGIIAGVIDIIGLPIFKEKTPIIEILIFSFTVLVLNYFWLVYKNRYKKIYRKFKNESKNQRFRNTILLWLYVVMSFVIVSFIAIISGNINGLN
ncbi:MAG: hypothetical protein V2I62_00025 [Bacteroidales bacterium]|nr:hypothetical protein [Bacteroidales bacterium]